MMLANLDTLVGAYRFDTSGYDATNRQLTDAGPYGHHLEFGGSGAPVFASHGGEECIAFDASNWFEGRTPFLGGGSFALLMAMDMDGANTFQALVNTIERQGSATNRTANPPSQNDADWFDGSKQGHAFTLVSQQATRLRTRVGNPSGGGPNLPRGELCLVTCAIPGEPAAHLSAVNADTTIRRDYAASQAKHAVPMGGFMRIGHLKATPGHNAGRYVALKRAWFFRGNVFDHAEFVSARAAELAGYGIA